MSNPWREIKKDGLPQYDKSVLVTFEDEEGEGYVHIGWCYIGYSDHDRGLIKWDHSDGCTVYSLDAHNSNDMIFSKDRAIAWKYLPEPYRG